jgi:signal transduction histidine kinase/CheY-like chemotaxis protein/HPt (histidine-containing phosphotransfer) domain-containing protein
LKRLASIPASVIGQVLLLLCTLAVIWSVIWSYLGAEYRRTVRDAVERSATLAQTLEENMSRSATVLDTALINSRAIYVHDPDHFKIGPWMRDKAVLMKIAVQMGIADASGTVVTASGDNGPPPVDIADREHFRVHVGSTEDRLFISAPVIGRTSGRLSIQFTRRIVNPDGTFAGVVIVSFDPLVIGEFQNGVRLNGGFTMLIGNDGVIRAAQPDTRLIGKTFPDSGMLRKINAVGDAPLPPGSEIVTDDLAIVSYRKIAGFPLFVAAGFPNPIVFALYQSERRSILLAGTVLSLTVLLVGGIGIRHGQRLTRFQRALMLTMDNISQGILMVDRQRRMPVVNRRVAELLELPGELVRPGANFDTLVEWQRRHGDFQGIPADDARVATMILKGGNDANLAFYERTRADGTVLEVRTNILPDGSAVRTFTDVTERKRIERDLANARDAAEAGSRARTEFLAVMSHEIRTPMNGIVGAVGLLRDMRLDAEQREYVRVIRESSEHLSTLIQDILDFTRLDAGRLELEVTAFDPRTLIQGAIAMLGGQALAKGLTVGATVAEEVPARVGGDPSRLRQILVNLIGNAIKFTNSGGVTVEARMIAADERTVSIGIAVTDTGIGIDPDSKRKLFSAFTQVDSSMSRRFGGSGLGLVICRHLVTLMGGTIDVDSTPGQGSTFQFSINLRPVPVEQKVAASGPAAAKSGRPLKVLLAEDNPTNRHVAVRMLTRMGHAVDAVEDGAGAVTAAAAADYDVILMDMMMPEVDGLTATRTIRASAPPRCDTVIVGLTANALPSDRAACEAAGMNDFVTKPVTLERLRAVLEQTAVRDLTASGRPRAANAVMVADTVTLDEAFLNQLAGEISPEGVAEMVRVFLEDTPPRMVAIRRAMADGAIQTIRREAHAMAGAAGSVGLPRLHEAAAALQDASERAGPDDATIEAVAAALHDSLPLVTAWAEAHEGLATEGLATSGA